LLNNINCGKKVGKKFGSLGENSYLWLWRNSVMMMFRLVSSISVPTIADVRSIASAFFNNANRVVSLEESDGEYYI